MTVDLSGSKQSKLVISVGKFAGNFVKKFARKFSLLLERENPYSNRNYYHDTSCDIY